MAQSQPVSTTDTHAHCTHFKALGFMARATVLETRRGQTWPLPLGCQPDHSAELCKAPLPPTLPTLLSVIPAWPRGAEQSACFPHRRASGADRKYVGFTHLQPKQVPAEIGKAKAPPGPQMTQCRDPAPQPPVMLGLPVGRGEGLRASQRETRHFLDLAVGPATLGNRLGAPKAGSATSGLITGELGSHVRGLRSHSR